jgi:transposase-like protein
MNRLDANQRIQVLTCILEGCSIRATVRMTGVSKKAVMRLMVEAGTVAWKFQRSLFRNLNCRRIQVDEL